MEQVNETERRFALKRLLRTGRQARERFFREVERTSTLSHPGIVRVFDAQQDGDAPYYVMEWLQGGTIEERRDRLRGDQRSVLRITIEIAQALGHAHTKGLIHRDVNPLCQRA